MKDSTFKIILLTLLILGVISVITLTIVTTVLYKQTSMITFIEKELW